MSMTDDPNIDAFQVMAAFLTEIGLGDLFTFDGGQPGGWLWDQFVSGNIDTVDQLQLAIEATPQWRTRFGAIVAQREAAARGEPVRPMSVLEVVEYERSVQQIMARAGLPAQFYDSYEDFQGLLVNQISAAEVDARINEGYALVADVDPNVRQAFVDMYGTTGADGALAAFFLDPEKSLRRLERTARASYAAGLGRTYNLQMDRDYAERFADLPLSPEATVSRLQEASAMKSLTRENFGEASDLTDTTLLDATLGEGEASGLLERRARSRQSVNREAIGGTLLTQEGAGLGSA